MGKIGCGIRISAAAIAAGLVLGAAPQTQALSVPDAQTVQQSGLFLGVSSVWPLSRDLYWHKTPNRLVYVTVSTNFPYNEAHVNRTSFIKMISRIVYNSFFIYINPQVLSPMMSLENNEPKLKRDVIANKNYRKIEAQINFNKNYSSYIVEISFEYKAVYGDSREDISEKELVISETSIESSVKNPYTYQCKDIFNCYESLPNEIQNAIINFFPGKPQGR